MKNKLLKGRDFHSLFKIPDLTPCLVVLYEIPKCL